MRNQYTNLGFEQHLGSASEKCYVLRLFRLVRGQQALDFMQIELRQHPLVWTHFRRHGNMSGGASIGEETKEKKASTFSRTEETYADWANPVCHHRVNDDSHYGNSIGELIIDVYPHEGGLVFTHFDLNHSCH